MLRLAFADGKCGKGKSNQNPIVNRKPVNLTPIPELLLGRLDALDWVSGLLELSFGLLL